MEIKIKMEDYLNKAYQLLDQISTELLEIESEESNRKVNPIFFYYSMVHKTVFTLRSTLLLLKSLPICPANNLAAGLLLRTIISDITHTEYVFLEHEKATKPINHILESLYYEHYRFSKRQSKLADLVFSGDPRFDALKKKFLEYENQFLEDDGNLPKHLHEGKSIYNMFLFIFSQTSKDEKAEREHYITLFDLYSIFSRLEHFGERTMDYIAKDFNDPANIIGCDTFKRGLENAIWFCISACVRLRNMDIGCKLRLSKLFDELEILHLCPPGLFNQVREKPSLEPK